MAKSIMNNLLKWTPASIIAVIVVTVCAITTLWYSFHFQAPPTWVFNTFLVFGGGSLMGVGASVGATTTSTAVQQGASVGTQQDRTPSNESSTK